MGARPSPPSYPHPYEWHSPPHLTGSLPRFLMRPEMHFLVIKIICPWRTVKALGMFLTYLIYSNTQEWSTCKLIDSHSCPAAQETGASTHFIFCIAWKGPEMPHERPATAWKRREQKLSKHWDDLKYDLKSNPVSEAPQALNYDFGMLLYFTVPFFNRILILFVWLKNKVHHASVSSATIRH